MRRILLASACLLFYVGTFAQTIMGRQIVDQFPRNSSVTLTYGLTWLPNSYTNTTRLYPLIISLHGAGETGTTVQDLSALYNSFPRAIAGRIADGWNAFAVNPLTGVSDSFIVVSPQAASWSYSYTELEYILPAILNKYRIDPRRIYLVGLSAGGGGTFSTFGSRDAAFIQNFAAMATASSAGVNASNGYTQSEVEEDIRYGSGYGVRMWTIAGELDYLIQTDIRYHDSSNMLSPSPLNKFTVIEGVDHSAWDRAYDPNFRPTINYYGNNGTCNNGCPFGGVPMAPNSNGSSVRGSGKTQDSLNLYEWLLLAQRPLTTNPSPVWNYRSNASKPGGGKWSNTANWRRFDGTNWVTTTELPNASTGTITIRSNDSLDLDIALTTDRLQIETTGILNVQTASLTITDGPGADLVVNGTLNLHNGQTISGSGTNELNGVLNWYGGTLSLQTTSSSGSTTNLSTNTNKILSANFINNGIFNWATGSTSGGISFNNATFTNNGTINEQFQSDRGFVSASGTNRFINNGTFAKATTFGFFNNSLPSTNTATGVLKGIGSFNFNFGSLTNSGQVTPGLSPGFLSINAGGISSQNATINIEVQNGLGAGTGHDVLDLTTVGAFTTNLNTVDLVVTEIGGLAPFQAYTILTTAGDFSGRFATATIPLDYMITYNATTVQVTKMAAPLPAEWGDFTALVKNDNVQLTWATLQENNTSHFEIQHSTAGLTYTTLATVPALGYSNLTHKYNYTHAGVGSNGNHYYRLRLIDLDGKTDFSQVRVIRFRNGLVKALIVTPNPVQNRLNVSVQEYIEIRLTDINGRAIKTQLLAAGNHTIDVSSLQAGVYILTAYRKGELVETQRIIKQ
jgi:hypothetical protein